MQYTLYKCTVVIYVILVQCGIVVYLVHKTTYYYSCICTYINTYTHVNIMLIARLVHDQGLHILLLYYYSLICTVYICEK